MNKIVVANIQSFSMIGGNVAQVVASTSKVETAADYANKIRARFDNRLEVVPNTVRDCTLRETAKAVTFHVRPVAESVPYTEQAVAQMREVVTANVFADAEDATWKVVESAGQKRLVKVTDTDIAALLQAAANQNMHRVAASNFDAGIGDVQDGEYALFVNPETASVDGGVITYGEDGGMRALARSSGKLINITREAIVAHSAFDIEGETEEETAAMHNEIAEFTKRDAQPMIAYFRKLFSSQPGFFAQLEAAIRRKFLLA